MIMGNQAPSDVYHIEEINIHPGWTARQEFTEREYGNPLGDGDILGLDLALLKLNRPVVNIYPARLPCESDDPMGLRTVHSGFGILVNGFSGTEDSSVDRRLGGENMIDLSLEYRLIMELIQGVILVDYLAWILILLVMEQITL